MESLNDRRRTQMAIMISLTLGGVPVDVFDQINEELDAHKHPPAGLVVHLAYAIDIDVVRVVDVWLSEEMHDAFDSSYDPPAALARILRQRGLGPPRLIGREVVEIQSLLRGPAA
jgi:hypothetical protein